MLGGGSEFIAADISRTFLVSNQLQEVQRAMKGRRQQVHLHHTWIRVPLLLHFTAGSLPGAPERVNANSRAVRDKQH